MNLLDFVVYKILRLLVFPNYFCTAKPGKGSLTIIFMKIHQIGQAFQKNRLLEEKIQMTDKGHFQKLTMSTLCSGEPTYMYKTCKLFKIMHTTQIYVKHDFLISI